MMSPEEIAQVLSIGLSFCAIWFCLFYLYRDFAADLFREKMFDLRAQFFEEAERGLIEFDHLAYGLLRSTMNGFIRYAHKLTLMDCLIIMLITRRKAETVHEYAFTKRWTMSIRDLPQDKKDRLEEFRKRMVSLSVKHVMLSSPCLMLTIAPICASLSIFRASPDSIKKKSLCKIETTVGPSLQSTALAYGKEVFAL